jgi:hypothetical protein
VDAGDPDDARAVRAAVARLGIRDAVYLDPDFAATRQLGHAVFPTFFLVDRAGMVRYRLAGALGAAGERALRRELDRLLTER